MASVTIRGSLTPCALLARGEEMTVQDTPRVRNLIRAGFFDLVKETPSPAPELATEPTAAVPDSGTTPYSLENPPRRNASREDWAEFLASFPLGIVTEGKGRDELVDAFYDRVEPAPDDPNFD